MKTKMMKTIFFVICSYFFRVLISGFDLGRYFVEWGHKSKISELFETTLKSLPPKSGDDYKENFSQ